MFCNVGFAEEFTESFVKKLTSSPLPDCKGNDYTKWTNCYGKYTNDSGRVTISEFGNNPGKRHGLGTSKTPDGTYLEAIFENDKAVSGKLFYPHGDIFDEAYNFFNDRVVFGKESWDKGNWANLHRAVCK